MKDTVVLKIKDGTLLYAFSSEVAWLPLMVGDYVEHGGQTYRVKERSFLVDDDRLEIRVK